ncbi:MAG: hypothetical protein ACFNS9_09505, partial [Actinomyces sp.]
MTTSPSESLSDPGSETYSPPAPPFPPSSPDPRSGNRSETTDHAVATPKDTTTVHTNSQAPSPATTIAERLSGGEPYIITFGGQATPWRQTLADLVSLDHALAADVVAVDQAVAERLAPVSTDLLTVTPR